VSKWYLGFVSLLCIFCCGFSLIAWVKIAQSTSVVSQLTPQSAVQARVEPGGFAQAAQDAQGGSLATKRLSPRMLRAFEQAHANSTPSASSDSAVIPAAYQPQAASVNEPKIVSVTDQQYKGTSLKWDTNKHNEIWLTGKEAILVFDTALPSLPSPTSLKSTSLNTANGNINLELIDLRQLRVTATKAGRYSIGFRVVQGTQPADPPVLEAFLSNAAPFTLIVPGDVTPLQSAIQLKRGNDYDWEKVTLSDPPKIDLFVDTNAQIKLTPSNNNTEFLGLICSGDNANLSVDSVSRFSGDTWTYSTHVNLGTFKWIPFEIDQSTKAARVSTKPIEIKTNLTTNPTLGKFTIDDKDPKSQRVLLNDPKAYRTIKLDYATQTVQPTDLIKVFLDGQQIAKKLGTTNPPTIQMDSVQLSEGRHRLTATITQGNTEVFRTPEVEYEMRTGGFRITEVIPKDFGIAINSKVIEIKLSRPLAASNIKNGTPNTLTEPAKAAFQVQLSSSGSRSGPFAGDSGAPADPTIKVYPDRQTVQLVFTTVNAGVHQVTIDGSKLVDDYGNPLEGSDGKPGSLYTEILGAPVGGGSRMADPLVPGVIAGRAPVVEYPSAIPAVNQPKGFNPNDRVETRVARLYFYRDAHRVAQILNRRAQSYGRQDVTVRRQLADQARREAEEATTLRQNRERSAVTAAQKTRELENKLNDAEQALNYTLSQMQQLAANPAFSSATGAADKSLRDRQLAQLEIAARAYTDQIRALESQVLVAREQEIASNEQWLQAQRAEELNKAEQFRLETAAAHTDPDTFAEGRPDSVDAVHQVSISVIGEGVLHLRGPLRGVNQVRLMIDQIDTPCGSVRINIHSTQINGDEADELEVVANRIQTYIDQARFMTMQSSEALRKAVLTVAAEKAEEARGMYPGETQEDRDQRYLYSFFGKDFVDELKALDSELLQTGNKLLSLHSMDVTSLSSALTLMALANNSTRMAILERFDELIQSDLSPAEQRFLENSVAECGEKRCTLGCRFRCKHKEPPPVFSLSPNASFTSMRGFFNANIPKDDTLNPIQREMIRLAQILKARLITELELKQRVMERAVIEERLAAAENEQDLLNLEQKRIAQLRETTEQALGFRSTILPALSRATAQIDAGVEQYESISSELIQMLNMFTLRFGAEGRSDESIQDKLTRIKNLITSTREFRIQQFKNAVDNALIKVQTPEITKLYDVEMFLHGKYLNLSQIYSTLDTSELDSLIYLAGTKQQRDELQRIVKLIAVRLEEAQSQLKYLDNSDTNQSDLIIQSLTDQVDCVIATTGALAGRNEKGQPRFAMISIYDLEVAIDSILQLLGEQSSKIAKIKKIQEQKTRLLEMVDSLFASTQLEPIAVKQAFQVYQEWVAFSQNLKDLIVPLDTTRDNTKEELKNQILDSLRNTDKSFTEWIKSMSKLDTDRALLQANRRPLDHKKFLDMLIDELEEKFIELLEGTRAHTANVDNYLKRLTTALDDDFNTQFYYPMFRSIRKGSQAYKVEFGQTETTNVLANNRELGKVSPTATMEFDLPRRDILVREGIDSALAIYNDAGALIQDPNFLALAKMKQGGLPKGVATGAGNVVNVYPSLSNPTSEQLLRQNAGSGPRFESNVEKLIPDPAIYKFETGTGYEVRPVIAPDGQAVVFDFNYMYTTQVREPVRADEKHLGRIRQHFIDTDVHLSNFELREVSRYVVALKAARTAKGVPLLEDIPVVGALWRPLPSDEKSLQQNIIMAQATIFPTLFDLMGLRWAPAVSDVDPLQLSNREYIVRNRNRYLENRIYDYSSSKVDEFLRIPEAARRADLYRSQESIPTLHPNGYEGPGLDYQVAPLQEGYDPQSRAPGNPRIPNKSPEGQSGYLPQRFDEAPAKRVIREELPGPEPYVPRQRAPILMRSPGSASGSK